MRTVAPPENVPLSQTANPHWDIVRAIPGNEFDWEFSHIWCPDWTSSYLTGSPYRGRHALCREYTFAIPDPDSLQFIAEHMHSAAIEIGAGTGYWAWQLSQLGVDILAYDMAPPHLLPTNDYHSPGRHDNLKGELRKTFYDIRQGTPEVLSQYADRVLFLCWPPMSDMAHQCLEHYQGKRLIYIGEGDGGCTGDEAFFARLEKEWKEIASHRLVQWWGIHDWITIYERK